MSLSSRQRPPPFAGEGQAECQEGAEGGAPAPTGGSSACVRGGLGTSRATLLPEGLVQLGCGPRLRRCVWSGLGLADSEVRRADF